MLFAIAVESTTKVFVKKLVQEVAIHAGKMAVGEIIRTVIKKHVN